ncbi:MAG: Nif3-like dinuclear metal center hexameric protein [Betaproteobacteria bacterium]|nr:Nif3-like dinuclear metal center hexameric protein [Betaproteobacteria bacterium]
MERDELARLLDNLLESAKFEDYSPNGLQVEGRAEIRRVITGVTASQALLDEAVRRNADAVIVHHGLFWRGDSSVVLGYRKRRLAALLKHDINLFAYHLPLDAHPDLGNNAQWGRAMNWQIEGSFGRQSLGLYGRLPTPCSLRSLSLRLEEVLLRPPLVVAPENTRREERLLSRLAWCSGGAQDYIEAAVALGVDAFLSGEISEQTPHVALESGMAYLACGHHASERFGPMALASWLSEHADIACEFVDYPNPAG